MGSASTTRGVKPAGPGVALQPVIDLIDRVDLGYEALPRPLDSAPGAVVAAALMLAQHTGPAILMIPLHRDVIVAEDFDLAALAQRHAVNPGELAWVIQGEIDSELGDRGLRRLRGLRDLGFLLAVDGVVVTGGLALAADRGSPTRLRLPGRVRAGPAARE